jgi:hypothetical protein
VKEQPQFRQPACDENLLSARGRISAIGASRTADASPLTQNDEPWGFVLGLQLGGLERVDAYSSVFRRLDR